MLPSARRLARLAAHSLPAWVAAVSLLLLWQAATAFWSIPVWQLPSPTRIGAAFWEWRYVLLGDIAVTLRETLLGFAVALLVAIPLAALLVSSSLLWRAFYPILAGIQSIPKKTPSPRS